MGNRQAKIRERKTRKEVESLMEKMETTEREVKGGSVVRSGKSGDKGKGN